MYNNEQFKFADRPLFGVVSPTHGGQEGTAYNGHFGCSCYHPLFVFNQFGDLERCALRPGNVHSAHGWRDVLEPVVTGYRGKQLRRFFRGNAAFTFRRLDTTTPQPFPHSPQGHRQANAGGSGGGDYPCAGVASSSRKHLNL